MMSLMERDGLLYGLSVFHVGKLHYDGSVIWRKYISGNARWMWQIISLGEGFAIRYQSSGDGAHRPGIALMDTTGTLSHDAVFDLVGSGYLNADLIAWDEGLALCATRFTDSSTTCHLILC